MDGTVFLPEFAAEKQKKCLTNHSPQGQCLRGNFSWGLNVNSPFAMKNQPVSCLTRQPVLRGFKPPIALLATAFFCCAALNSNAQIIWDYEWNGSVLPNENLAAPLSIASNTPSYLATYSVNGPDPGEEVTVNVTTTLNPDDTFTLDMGGVLQTTRSYRNSTEWTGWDPGNYSVVEMRLRVDEQYPQLSSSIYENQTIPVGSRYAQYFRFIGDVNTTTPDRRFALFLRPSSIHFSSTDGSGSNDQVFFNVDLSDFQTLRIFFYDTEALVYLYDENLENFVFLGSNESTITAGTGPASPMLEFGSLFTNRGSGRVTYDYIRWANNIPEPGVAGLLALAGSCLMLRRRRNNSLIG